MILCQYIGANRRIWHYQIRIEKSLHSITLMTLKFLSSNISVINTIYLSSFEMPQFAVCLFQVLHSRFAQISG